MPDQAKNVSEHICSLREDGSEIPNGAIFPRDVVLEY